MNCRKTDVERQTVNAYSQINKDKKTYKIKPPLITEVKSDDQEDCTIPALLATPILLLMSTIR